jgi:lipopolysaccharide transport system ATP-binding protein
MGTLVVSNVSKAYKRYPGKWTRAREWLFGTPCHESTWILRDINFRVEPGEAVGIVGVNGAGKSTLLKIITGTTQPTSGHVFTNGRVAALLELGMGFHPDFTGRQNALMAGQLAGLSQDQTIELMPSIEQFADIGMYFDQPIRIYSSGMQARVAFAVATASRPDILIVDEVLSVGDLAFQAKCMIRMNALLDAGCTILFVSHAPNQVRQFCSTALYISGGRVKAFGPAEEICDLYQNDLADQGRAFIEPSRTPDKAEALVPSTFSTKLDVALRKNSVGGSAGGRLDLEFIWFDIFDIHGVAISSCKSEQEVVFRACIKANLVTIAGANVGLLVADKSGYHLFACNTNYYDIFLPSMKPGDHVVVEWQFKMPLASGDLRIDIGIKESPFSDIFFDRVFCARTLVVIPDVNLLKRNFGGYLFVNDAKVSVLPA